MKVASMKNLMYKSLIIILLFGLSMCNYVFAANVQNSKPAAPYTKQALEKLADLLDEYGLPATPVKENITSRDMLETYINHYIKIWGIAGYDFRKSIDKYVHDMNINPVALGLPPLYEYSMPEALGYATIVKYYKKNEDELVLKKYFSQETVNHFNKNIQSQTSNRSQYNSKYWFPQGINPSMLTDSQLHSFEVVDIDKYRKSANYAFSNSYAFVEAKVKKAKEQGRPVINKDLEDANKDYGILKRISYSLCDGYTQSAGGQSYGSLSRSQENELNRILNEYGTCVLDDKTKSRLEKYRLRQGYWQNNNASSTYAQSQSTYNQQPAPLDRNGFHKIYDGIDYTYSNLSNPRSINTWTNILSPVINAIGN